MKKKGGKGKVIGKYASQKTLAKEYHRRRKLYKEKKIYEATRKKFTPTKREANSYVFVNRQGKRVPPTSKAKGYLFYVYPDGQKRIFSHDETPKLHRISDYDVSRSGKTEAIRKWQRKFNLKVFGRVIPVENKEGISYRQVGTRVTDALRKAYDRSGKHKPQMKIEVIATIGGKKVRTSLMMTSGQVRQQLEGNRKAISNMVWNALSNELAMENMVTVGSSEAMRRINKGRRKAAWRDKSGEKWGKSKYKQVKITKVEFRFSK